MDSVDLLLQAVHETPRLHTRVKIKKKNVGESRSDLVDRFNRLILALITICNFDLLAEPIK